MRWARTAAAVALMCLGIHGPVAAETRYSFAVVPQYGARTLFTIWKPIVDDVARRTGIALDLVATLDVPHFEKELAAGHFDFVYANPYQVMREAGHQGYRPLVRDAVPLRGIVVVPKDSPVTKPADLNGLTLAVPSPNAVGASLLIRSDLERLYGARVTLLNAKTHSSVYLHVVNGLADAGGGVEKTFAEQAPSVRDALRVVYVTRDLPSHPIAAHPRVPKAVQDAVRQALLDLAASGKGPRLLAAVPMTKMVPAVIADYRAFDELGLERYWVDE